MKKTENHKISFQKIPSLSDITSWKKVKIQECGEKLMLLNDLFPDSVIVKSQYFLQGLKGSMEKCYVRETVAKLLIKASKLLPNNYKLVIWDAWRPIKIQEIIFNRYKERLKKNSSNLSEEETIHLAQKYISLPSSDEDNPSPHDTGGSVDLSIVDSSGNYLNMGTSFDDFSDKSNTRYYEQLIEEERTLSDRELIILNNRRLLFYVMNRVGFTNYPEEWWHYDYGNQLWGKIKGENAIYGKISLQDWT